MTIDAALMRNLRENPFELLALVTAAGLTPHFERRAWTPEEWPELVKLLEARGECVLHCVKYKGEAFEPRYAIRRGSQLRECNAHEYAALGSECDDDSTLRQHPGGRYPLTRNSRI